MTDLRTAAQQALAALEDSCAPRLASKHYAAYDAALAALKAALEQDCVYTIKDQDGFGTAWTTGCGSEMYISAPEEVGFSFAPMPNANGKHCRFCGKVIVVKDKRARA